jgi:hypothetical protein
MRERIAGDPFLGNAFFLARELGVTLRAIRQMDLAEYNGWLAYLKMEQEAHKSNG